MCYNVAYIEKRGERVAKHYGATFQTEIEFDEKYHVSGFSHPDLFVITCQQPQYIQPYRWGLIPKWVKDEQQANELSVQTLNAKAETVFEKPSFRNSIANKRCIVIVNGFYEWRTVGKKKYPYYIHLKAQDFFSLGGIYENWVNKSTGELMNTFSIITVEANPLLQKIHNSKKRMPLIIPVEKEKEWIKSDLSKTGIQSLMLPFDENKMEAYTISKLITDRTQHNNVPEVMHRFEYPELELLE